MTVQCIHTLTHVLKASIIQHRPWQYIRMEATHTRQSAGSVLRNSSNQHQNEFRLTSSSNKKVSPKVLLLPGDEYLIASNGVSRTVYDLCNASPTKCQSHEEHSGHRVDTTSINNTNSTHSSSSCKYSVEEQYNLNSAQKTFIIQDKNNAQRLDLDLDLDPDPDPGPQSKSKTIHIQEIQNGIETAGTGACTWESSIVSALYFSNRPALVSGNVLELGSGIGLAALLTINLVSAGDSLTLSDYSPEVIQQCRENLKRNTASTSTRTPRSGTSCNASNAGILCQNTKVVHLDWYDSVRGVVQHKDVYDTIIGSDIVYRRQDIIPLLTTISRQLHNDDTNTNTNYNPSTRTAHLFGPNNRAVLHELVDEVRKNHHWKTLLDVKTEIIAMDRSRLEPTTNRCASRRSSFFLHVEISHASQESRHDSCHPDIADID
jgi:predicted nicotinamide N-methyase